MSFQIFMLVPTVNDGSAPKEGLKRGKTLLARGMVRLDEMYVAQAEHEHEAKRAALRIAYDTICKQGLETMVVGYVVRHRLEKRKRKPRFMVTLEQVNRMIQKRRERKAA